MSHRKFPKPLAYLMIMAILMSLFTFAPMASAASTDYSALTAPEVEDDTENARLGTVLVTFNDYLSAGTHIAWVSLPSNYDINTVTINGQNASSEISVADNVYVRAAADGTDGFRLTVRATADISNDVSFRVDFAAVDVPAGVDAGAIEATFDNVQGQLLDGKVTIGYVAGGGVELSVVDDNTFGDNGGTVTIRVKETVKGSLNNDDELKLILPDGFEWGTVTLAPFDDADPSGVNVLWGTVDPDTTNGTTSDSQAFDEADLYINNDQDELVIRLANADVESVDRVAFDVKVPIIVEDIDDAEYGDIVAKVKGDYDATPSELTVGKYGDFGATIEADAPDTEVFAGFDEQDVSDIKIEESLGDSLVDGRTILLKLPANARWATINDTAVEDLLTNDPVCDTDEGVRLLYGGLQGTDDRTLKLVVDEASVDSDAAELTIEDIQVALEAGVTGDLVVEVSGSAGLSGEITIAKVVAPITVTADSKTIVVGKYGQEAGDIVITETKAGAINETFEVDGVDEEQAVLWLDLPSDVRFDGEPEVEVTKGDLKIDEVDLWDDSGDEDNVLAIYIDKDSNEASTITISGIKYAVNRVLPEGDIKVKIGGTAVVETFIAGYLNSSDEIDEPYFEDSDAAATVVNANCGTPAPSSKTVSFRIGDEGVVAMNGRTLVQVNLLCDVLGLQKSWDANSKTAFFVKDGTVVAFPIGKNQIVIGGAAMTVDQGGVAYNNFTYATLRGLQMAFGGELTWDQATQTATFQF